MKLIKFGILSLLLISITSANLYAMVQMCEEPYCGGTQEIKHGRFSSIAKVGRVQQFSIESLNLKSHLKEASTENVKTKTLANARSAMSQAIDITLADFEKISANRNSWVLFQDENVSFSMDIGSANASTQQTWSLPNDFFDNYQFVSLEDFIPISEVPNDLRFSGANKVSKQYYLDIADNEIDVFTHFSLGNSQIDQLGSSYYYYIDGDDESFDGTDYKFSDVPISLNQGYTFTEEASNFDTGLFLTKYTHTKAVDAFGVLVTPAGDYDCLRFTFSSDKYTRPDTLSAFAFNKSFKTVGFVTKEGFVFVAEVGGLSGTQTLTNIETKLVLPTALFDDNAVLQINNDGTGIAINDYGAGTDASAILDVESDSLGILIPRIIEAKRPPNAATGLLIYQIDNSPGFYYYDGVTWQRLDNSAPAPSARKATAVPNENIEKAMMGISKLNSGSVFIPYENSNPDNVIIQLQAEGENKGLFISKKTAKGFEVKEQGQGKSNVKFSYTINQ